jgi:16S rRNA G966 N2-methylase RsmD
LRENLKSLGLEGRAELRQGRATALIGRITADIVFLDPPYELHSEYETALTKLGEIEPALVAPLIIAQHDVRLKLEPAYGALHQTRVLRQGDNCLSFYAATN